MIRNDDLRSIVAKEGGTPLVIVAAANGLPTIMQGFEDCINLLRHGCETAQLVIHRRNGDDVAKSEMNEARGLISQLGDLLDTKGVSHSAEIFVDNEKTLLGFIIVRV